MAPRAVLENVFSNKRSGIGEIQLPSDSVPSLNEFVGDVPGDEAIDTSDLRSMLDRRKIMRRGGYLKKVISPKQAFQT